jgi:hypothetical protein
MLGQESKELAEIAGIGFRRLGRQAALGAQMRQPSRHFDCDRFVGAVKFNRLLGGLWLCHICFWRDDSLVWWI